MRSAMLMTCPSWISNEAGPAGTSPQCPLSRSCPGPDIRVGDPVLTARGRARLGNSSRCLMCPLSRSCPGPDLRVGDLVLTARGRALSGNSSRCLMCPLSRSCPGPDLRVGDPVLTPQGRARLGNSSRYLIVRCRLCQSCLGPIQDLTSGLAIWS